MGQGYSPVLTGIPRQILVLAQLDSLTQSQLTAADEVVTRIREELENRDIGGDYHVSRLISETNESHSKIIDSISEVKAIALSAASSPSSSKGHRDMLVGQVPTIVTMVNSIDYPKDGSFHN